MPPPPPPPARYTDMPRSAYMPRNAMEPARLQAEAAASRYRFGFVVPLTDTSYYLEADGTRAIGPNRASLLQLFQMSNLQFCGDITEASSMLIESLMQRDANEEFSTKGLFYVLNASDMFAGAVILHTNQFPWDTKGWMENLRALMLTRMAVPNPTDIYTDARAAGLTFNADFVCTTSASYGDDPYATTAALMRGIHTFVDVEYVKPMSLLYFAGFQPDEIRKYCFLKTNVPQDSRLWWQNALKFEDDTSPDDYYGDDYGEFYGGLLTLMGVTAAAVTPMYRPIFVQDGEDLLNEIEDESEMFGIVPDPTRLEETFGRPGR